MTSVNERIKALQAAEWDYQHMMRDVDAFERRAIAEKLRRIRRQIAMLTEDDRRQAVLPEQPRRFQ